MHSLLVVFDINEQSKLGANFNTRSANRRIREQNNACACAVDNLSNLVFSFPAVLGVKNSCVSANMPKIIRVGR